MSNLFELHPEGDLVRYLDGELSRRRRNSVERHLESCGRCRAELEECKHSAAEYARYRESLAAQMPAAPQPWRDLNRDFSRIDESLANTSLLVRLTRPLVHSGAPRWAFVVGLAALIVLGSLDRFRQAPSVQAATLLRRAVAEQENHPRPPHRIRVRTSQREFTRMAGVAPRLLDVAETQAVAALFQAAHYDWNDPLSARAFEDWRGEQAHKTDEVTAVTDSHAPLEHLTRIRTVSAEGALEAASITLDTANYLPVEERLEFRQGEWVELSEIAVTSTESAGGSVATHVEVPVRAAEPPSRPAALSPGSPASISDELQALAALSAIEADLGDWVDVALADGKVVVTGAEDIPAGRQAEIRAALANLPNVAVEFSPAHPVSVPPEAAVAGGAVSAPDSAVETRLEKQLGGRAGLERFSSEVLDLSDAAMQRVYALHRLAQKFPAEEEAQLTSQDLNVLHELSRKHTAVLAEKVSDMERILVPALSSLGGTAASVPPAGSRTSWQPAADDVYRSARRVEVLVSQALGMTPGNVSAGALPSDLMAALQDLQSNVDACQKLLAAR